MHVRAAIAVLFAVLLGAARLSAQNDGSQGKKKFPFRIHGFVLANYSARLTDAQPPGEEGGRFLWADERLRLEVYGEAPKKHLSLLFKGDVFHDAAANKLGGVVREAYVDYARGPLDLRVGRQIVTWGVGDLVFINDVFPKDWNAFFSGRPIEYLKLGADAAKIQLSTPELNAELVVIPFFQPDNLPNPQRFLFFDPFPAVSNRTLRQPASTTGNTEFALRLYGRLLNSDVSVYAYRGFWRQPAFRPDQFPMATQLRGFYPQLSVYGASVQHNVGNSLISGEAGYYDSRDDHGGRDPAIPNSQVRLLAGYQRQLASEFTLGAQYYAEIMTEYSAYQANLPPTFPVQDRVRHLVTLRLTKFLKYQTWRLSWFSLYSPSDQDALLIPEVWHAINDRLSVAVGANIFAGTRPSTFLGQFDRNDNAYGSIRFDF